MNISLSKTSVGTTIKGIFEEEKLAYFNGKEDEFLLQNNLLHVGLGKKSEFTTDGNANYMWMQTFYSHLNDLGTAGFVMANGAMTTNNIGEKNVSGFGLTAKAWRDFDFMEDMDIPMRKGSCCGVHFCDSTGSERLYTRISTTKRTEYKEASFYAHGMYRIAFDRYLAKVAEDAGAEIRVATVGVDVLRKGEGLRSIIVF